jgi:hypothetical protein
MDDLFNKAVADVDSRLGLQTVPDAGTPEAPPEEEASGGMLDTIGGLAKQSLTGAYDLWQSAGAGIAKAGFETKDLVLGEPTEDEKSGIRKEVEAASAMRREKSTANGVVESVSQFATGMLGVGKLAAPIKGVAKLKAAGKAGRFAYESLRGATAAAVVIDPHEERLSNLIQEFDILENPVTEFLAASPDDSAAMGRFKNALEGIGFDLALAGTFAAGVKAVKLYRGGQADEAIKVLKKAEKGVTPAEPKVAGKAGEVLQIDEVAEAEAKASSTTNTVAKEIPAKEATPRWDPAVKVSEIDAETIIKDFEAEEKVLREFGSREEALKAGVRVPRANVPWQKIGGSEDLQALVSNTSKVLRQQMDAAKGGSVLSDAKVRDMVTSTAEMFGDDPALLMGHLAKSGDQAKSMVADMEASYIISRRLFEDAHDAALKTRMGMLDELGGSLETAQAEVLKRFQAAADMLAAGNSMRASAGRSLRRLRSDFAITPEDVAQFSKLPKEQLTEVLYRTGGDLKKLKQAANPAWQRRVLDEATFALTNNLLWFYPTHLVNTTTNFYMLAARPTEKLLGSMALGKGGSAVRRQALKEYAYMTNSLGDAWHGMVEAFKRGDSLLSPHHDEFFEQGSRVNAGPLPWRPVNDVWDLFHNAYMSANYRTIVGLPTRSLGAVDEFVKTLRYRAVVQARAAVGATEAGIPEKDLAKYIQGKLTEAFTPDGRGLDSQAITEAQISTFQQELLSGTAGAAVRNFRHNYPVTALVLPFVKTPVNVLRYAWKMTPGLNMLQTEYRQMLKGALGPEAQAQAVGQMALGSTFMAMAAGLAASGRITGGGPADPQLRKQLTGSGWQPYSFVIENGDGSKTYVPIGRFDPVGMPFGMVADIVDMQITHPNSREAEKGMMAVGVALAKAFSEKTFLLNVNGLLRAITEPENNLGKWAGNLAGNVLVPGSSAVRNYANSDPYVRDARGFLDNAMKGLPGYSETIPPARDAFGEPLWRKRSLSTNQDLDLVEAEHSRIIMETGFGVRPPAASRNGLDLRDVTLSDGKNAYDVYQQLSGEPGRGKTLKESLAKLIQSDGYQSLVDGPSDVKGTKLSAISTVVGKYRANAFKMLLKTYPEFRQQVAQRQLQVKSEVSAKREAQKGAGGGGVETLLKSLGY